MSNRTLENQEESSCNTQKQDPCSGVINTENAKHFYSIIEKIINVCHEIARGMEYLEECRNDRELSSEIEPLNKFIKKYEEHYFEGMKEYNELAQKVGLKPIDEPKEQEELLRNLTKGFLVQEFILETVEKLRSDGLIVSIQTLYQNFLIYIDLR